MGHVGKPGKIYYDKNDRCIAMVTKAISGRRCRRKCVPGSDRCEIHVVEPTSPKYMHQWYVRKLRPAMHEALKKQIEETDLNEQLSCTQELALCREAGQVAVEMYDKVCEQPNVTVEAKVIAASVLQDSMRSVMKGVKDAADVEKVKADVVGAWANMAGAFIEKVIRAASAVFEDDHRVALLEEKLYEIMNAAPQHVAADGRIGTDITPDMVDATVREMDSCMQQPDLVEELECPTP